MSNNGIAMMGSGAFLIIYAAVNAGHLRILDQIGATKSIVMISLVLCVVMFIVLEIYTFRNSPEAVWTMVGLLALSFLGARVYKSISR